MKRRERKLAAPADDRRNAGIVDKLRADNALSLSLVAKDAAISSPI